MSSHAVALPALQRSVELGSTDYEGLFAADASCAIAAVDPGDPAWLFYTSGTTGRPKGVVLSHGNLLAMSLCFLADVEGIHPGDAILHPAPLSHGSGLYVLPHVLAGAVNVVPQSGGFDPAEILSLLGRWDRSCLFAAPTMVKRLVEHPLMPNARLHRLKSVVCGGAPMYVEDCKAALAALGPKLAQIYGQGESPMTITAMSRAVVADAGARGDDARLGSVGVAQTGIEVRIGGSDDAALPAGEVGEVLVRGPTVMQGYWQNPEASAAALANGWLHTGDVGYLDADGFLTLKDRSKDLIISGGSNIYPREVEEVLQRHAAVGEVAVVGRRHADWGEEVVACVVARGNIDAVRLERELDALCLEHIARFKRPKAYVFLPELPKNNTGKVLKTALRERDCATPVLRELPLIRLLRAVTHVVALVEDDVPRPRRVQPPDGRERGDQLAVGIAHGSRAQGERAGVEHLDPLRLPRKWRLRFLVEALPPIRDGLLAAPRFRAGEKHRIGCEK